MKMNELKRSIKFMGLYDEFLDRIDAGEELKINELTPEVLRTKCLYYLLEMVVWISYFWIALINIEIESQTFIN
jgi:hypothetical protein